MSRRPTLHDVAREAGVSIATVNRVVKGAKGVREDTARKVAEAASRIGYHGRTLIAQNARMSLPTVRIGVVLHKEKQEFYRNFAESIQRAANRCGDANVRLEFRFSTSQAPTDAAAGLREMAPGVDAVAATAINHHLITEAAEDIQQAGVPVYSLLSDFAQGVRESYFGLNNLKVGRGAANMLEIACRRPGKIALFVGGNRWHGHELRETGFRMHFRDVQSDFEVLDTFVNLETRQLTYEATLDLLSRHRDLVGIHLAGGGMEGAIAALREETEPGQIAMVVNERTQESFPAMADGYVSMIIGTPLDALSDALVAAIVAQVLGTDTLRQGQNFFDPVLYLPEFF